MQAKRLCFLARRRHDAAARPRHAARASAHLPRLPFGCPPTLLMQQPLWEPCTGTETGHGGHVRVTHNTRLVGAYDRSDGLSSDRSRSTAARRDSRWRRRGIGRLDAVISPVACGRVSSRIMISVF